MRLLALMFIALVFSPPLHAQGTIISRCGSGVGGERDCATDSRPCISGRSCVQPCGPARPCGSPIVRTSSHVRAELADRVLRYEVEETFLNRGGGLGEADYIFPLPRGAAFQDLQLSINGELVAGEAMSADRARSIYEEIVRRQKDPALVEWMGAGMLRTRIFPIAPGEEKRVVVRFQMVAEREGDALRVDYARGRDRVGVHMVRVVDGPQLLDRDDGRTRPERGREESFTLTYSAAGQYGEPYSPTHALDRSEHRGHRRVTARGDGRDVTILLPLRRGDAAAISLLAHAAGGEDGFALITLGPPAVRIAPAPRDVSFVVDVSGSMSGKKIVQARAAGHQLLATLSPRDRFRIIDFATDVRTFHDSFLPATRENIARAGRYLDDLQASGSTNISGALDEALRGSRDEAARDSRDDEATEAAFVRGGSRRVPVVLFVTDGEPTVGERRPEAIAERAARERGQTRIFTFGVGADVNVSLLERLALDGRGTAHFVRPDESVERAVAVLASRLTSPIATDVRLRVDGRGDPGVRLSRVHPAGAIDVFAGQDVVILARYAGSGRATLRFEGRNVAGPVRWTQDVEFPDRERGNSFVPRLWATQRIGYLSAERRIQGSPREVDAEIRELGERYGIPTEFSSYLVLEPGMVANDLRRLPPPSAVSAPSRTEGAAGAGQAAAKSDPVIAQRQRSFDEAKSAAGRREARTLAAADALDGERLAEGATGWRRVGDRLFILRDGTWTDARLTDKTPRVRVKAYSYAYFEVLTLAPELRAVLALGNRVVVAGRDVVIEVGVEGEDRLNDSQRQAIRSGW